MAANLPADLPAAVCVVVHIPGNAHSVLPRILERAGPLAARHAANGDVLQPGTIFVAPPDHHLLIEGDQLRLSHGPRQNGHRPAIDPLFRTAARQYRKRVIGVVLSGTMDDGTQGLMMIKRHGGLAVVQDPDDAAFDGMPRSALQYVRADHVAVRAELGALLGRLALDLTGLPIEEGYPMTDNEEDLNEATTVASSKAAHERGERPGDPTVLTCPDCGGVLWELNENNVLRFRCHLGHSYSSDSMQDGLATSLEAALWTALRKLEESAALARRMAFRARSGDNDKTAAYFETRAQVYEQQADAVRGAISANGLPATGALAIEHAARDD
jgi:two-component system, chemotaxis family, protein-glutamate methylesterase/glutaminase